MQKLDLLKKDREQLIKALQLFQSKEGYISDEAVKKIAEHFNLSPVEVEGVASFYTQFTSEKPAKYKIAVCDGTACHIKGSSQVLNWLNDHLEKNKEEDGERLFSVETVACLGCCSLAPVISINGKVYGKLNRKSLIDIIGKYREREAKNDKKD